MYNTNLTKLKKKKHGNNYDLIMIFLKKGTIF